MVSSDYSYAQWGLRDLSERRLRDLDPLQDYLELEPDVPKNQIGVADSAIESFVRDTLPDSNVHPAKVKPTYKIDRRLRAKLSEIMASRLPGPLKKYGRVEEIPSNGGDS